MALIEQQEAVDALNAQANEMSHWHERYTEQRKGILTAVRIVSDIKPKTGKWKPRYYDVGADVYVEWACSECGYVRQKGREDGDAGEEPEADFCEKCGADMRTKEADCDYERAVEQLEHDMLYEPTFNPDDGSM